MSITMYGISNSGAGATGGLSFRAAILHVSAPVGSTVTISKSGATTKSLGPERSHVNSDSGNSEYYFSITPANYGTWTVTATNGTDTASETVNIANNNEYDVILTYNYYLFKSGIGGVIPLSSDHEANSSISIGTSGIGINYTSSSGYQIFCCNTNAIDLSAFSALCVEGLITERQTSSQYGGSVAVASSMMVVSDDINNSKYVLKTPILTGSSMQTTILDIASIRISGYVGIRGGMKGTISAIYLKR